MKIFPIPNNHQVLLFSGDRNWSNRDSIRDFFARVPENIVVVHGAARGLDSLADEIALDMGIATIPCPAHWRHNDTKWSIVHGSCPSNCSQICGPGAGAIRNRWMLDTYHPILVVAFHPDLAQSRGTKNMVEYALTKHVATIYFNGERWHSLLETMYSVDIINRIDVV